MVLQPHQIYGWTMNAERALHLLSRIELVPKAEQAEIRAILRRGDGVVPEHLWNRVEQMYLLQLGTPTLTKH